MKTELDALKGRMNNAGEWISDLEDRIMEITQSQQTAKRKKKSNIRNLWDIIKHATLLKIGIPEI